MLYDFLYSVKANVSMAAISVLDTRGRSASRSPGNVSQETRLSQARRTLAREYLEVRTAYRRARENPEATCSLLTSGCPSSVASKSLC